MVGQYWPAALALAGWLVGTYEAVEQVSCETMLFIQELYSFSA
jgi:hypothetical protein